MNLLTKAVFLVVLSFHLLISTKLSISLRGMINRIKEVRNKVECAIDNEDFNTVIKVINADFRNSKKGLYAIIRLLRTEQIVKDVLTIEVVSIELYAYDVLLFNSCNKDGFLSSIDEVVAGCKRNLNRLVRIKNRLKLESEIIAKIKSINKRDLRKVGMDNLSVTLRYVELKEQVDSMINRSNLLLYRSLVPNKTVKQLNTYINSLVFNDNALSRYSESAFLELYEILCSDGEIVTLEAFKKECIKNENSVNYLLFEEEKFKSRYNKDEWIAIDKGRVVNDNEVYERHKYADLLQLDSIRTKIDLIILKKITAPDLFYKKYLSALNSVENYRGRFKDNKSLLMQIDEFASLIEMKRKEGNSIYLEKMSVCSDEVDELNFIYDHSFNRLAILPLVTDENLVRYQKNEDDFVKTDSSIYEEKYCYWYENGVLKKEDKVSTFNLKQLNRYQFCKDFYISPDHRIALFISDSPMFRKEVIGYEYSTEFIDEYNSIGLIPRSLSLQEYKKSRGYRGKTYGNTNSDIYYCIFDDETNQWSNPRILKGVNSPYSERCPYITDNKNTLYFCSEGYNGFGGYDIFSIPISIDFKKKEISISGLSSIKNEALINSVKDDLFYRRIQGQGYFSSNRDHLGKDDFDIYKIINKESDQYSDSKKLIYLADDISLEYNCYSSTPDILLPNDHIMVTGRIFSKDKHLFPRSKITFISKQGQIYTDSINIPNDRDSSYSLIVPHNKAFFVEILGYDEDYSIKATSQSFLFTCKNLNSNSDFIIKKDHDLEQTDMIYGEKKRIRNKVSPKTNIHDINSLINLELIRKIYAPITSVFKDEKSYVLFNSFTDKQNRRKVINQLK